MLWTKFPFIYGILQLLLLMTCSVQQMMLEETGDTVGGQVFSNRIYKAVSDENKRDGRSQNMIISPLSIEIVLAAVGFGARGKTQHEISTALGMPFDLEAMRKRYSTIVMGFEDEACILRVATNMFVQKDYGLTQNFVNTSLEVFTCGVSEVDYVSSPVEALGSINGWVEEKTVGLIKELLTIDAITVDTRLVLANAVYFKGKWAYPFDKANTRKEKFNVGGGEQVDVDMMFIDKRFRYGYSEDLKAQVLELPYEGGKLSMVVFLPSEDSSLTHLEEKISGGDFDLNELLANHTRSQEVMVHLPKFKLELTTNLESILIKLGMGTMLSDAADFSGITTSPEGLKVSRVVQKAFIEVSEEGTEAAAATGLVFVAKSVRRVKSLNANHPFTFILQERTTGTTLFTGSVVNPMII